MSAINIVCSKFCAQCNKPPAEGIILKICSKCKSVYYCNVECQKQHWQVHKPTCGLSDRTVTLISQPAPEGKTAPISEEPTTTEPTTTGYLRFLQIWLHAQKQSLTGKQILFFGPGRANFGGVACSPQLEEALQMWDKSHFMILDSNQKVLNTLKRMNHDTSQQYLRETFEINQACMKTTRQLELVKQKLTAKEPGKNTVVFKRFRIGEDDPRTLPDADVILATLSISYPLQALVDSGQDQNRQGRIALFAQYLSKLKPGGTLYIEKTFILSMLSQLGPTGQPIVPPDDEILATVQRILTNLNERVPFSLEKRELPMVIRYEHKGDYYVRQPQGSDFVDTGDVWAFTRPLTDTTSAKE